MPLSRSIESARPGARRQSIGVGDSRYELLAAGAAGAAASFANAGPAPSETSRVASANP
jgi:phosphoglycolate phosphatase-like HAD superfamily hydrolase